MYVSYTIYIYIPWNLSLSRVYQLHFARRWTRPSRATASTVCGWNVEIARSEWLRRISCLAHLKVARGLAMGFVMGEWLSNGWNNGLNYGEWVKLWWIDLLWDFRARSWDIPRITMIKYDHLQLKLRSQAVIIPDLRFMTLGNPHRKLGCFILRNRLAGLQHWYTPIRLWELWWQ